ncbi:hypothetical protein J2T09_002419 [Neorhizobium huautlense]|uniref:Uncharacterized protein n=1 Tax=Neorhizobium huautlense TaxID=67774 RepID=A0ABT9PT65_9HYPH|nr:hypothetical protein [Neorhizobium huautlense]MDP9837662.1 hypothetical protein [Neorhizobium huautlense]
MTLVCHGPMPDVFIDGRPSMAVLQAAFATAFAVPSPSLFEGEDTSVTFVDHIDRHTVATCWRMQHEGFATKLDIHLFEREDVAPRLVALAALLRMPVAIDLGVDIADDLTVLFMPDGAVLKGFLTAVAGADGRQDMRFSEIGDR